MSKIEIEICDRCGKEIKWLRRGIQYLLDLRGIRGYHILFGHRHPVCPYSYGDMKLTLCKDCGEKLSDFLFKKEDEKQ